MCVQGLLAEICLFIRPFRITCLPECVRDSAHRLATLLASVISALLQSLDLPAPHALICAFTQYSDIRAPGGPVEAAAASCISWVKHFSS
ncbi:hypothetical protein BDW22DRAFT_1360738 [Trametopsis cervina]|nr:hypothetical protein BDW22DRAFT_1360738 [Trametopsis cervina]